MKGTILPSLREGICQKLDFVVATPAANAAGGRSRRQPEVSLGTLAERGDGSRTGEPPVDRVAGVEPHEPEKAVEADSGEQVGDFRRLDGCWRSGCLGDEDRIVGQSPHGDNGWPEHRCENRGRAGVVAVDSDPVHVGGAGPPWTGCGYPALLVEVVDRPQPGDVRGARRPEERDNVPPGGYED